MLKRTLKQCLENRVVFPNSLVTVGKAGFRDIESKLKFKVDFERQKLN